MIVKANPQAPPTNPGISSTIWPEPVTRESSTRHTSTDAASPAGEPHSPERSLPNGSTQIDSGLALLLELEASLHASQRALLSGDLDRLQQATCEQIRMRNCLALLWAKPALDALKIDAQDSGAAPVDCTLVGQVRAAQQRVLDCGRIQVALVTRAERRLRTIENVLAGPGATYASPGQSRFGEGDACRV